MSDNYADIANRSWDDIPKPQTLPDGSWLLRGRNATYMPPKDNTNARILFFYAAKTPMDDVDTEALEALGADYDFAENDIVATFWLERSKDWDRVREHLKLHGIDVTGKSIPDTLKEFKNTEVIAYLTQKTFTRNDGSVSVDNVPTQFARVE